MWMSNGIQITPKIQSNIHHLNEIDQCLDSTTLYVKKYDMFTNT